MSEPLKLPPEAQEVLMKLQVAQQQAQAIALQKETFAVQKNEFEKALEELGKVKENEEVYKAVGPILIKSNKAEMEGDLKEKLEAIEVRSKTIEKQEKKLEEDVKQAQEKLQEFLKGAGPKGAN